jgi:hypothetical protein
LGNRYAMKPPSGDPARDRKRKKEREACRKKVQDLKDAKKQKGSLDKFLQKKEVEEVEHEELDEEVEEV